MAESRGPEEWVVTGDVTKANEGAQVVSRAD